MAIKYTIFKVIIQNSSKGFTLIELIFGLLIMSLIGTLALNAFIGASTDFNKDKRNIDSSQNLSAILEMIGNDIKESGEKINDPTFPTIEFKLATVSDTGLMLGSSKVIIRKAVSDSLTLCQDIASGTAPSSLTTLLVADSSAGNSNCDVGTQTSQLQAVRPSANLPNSTYELTTLAGAIVLPPTPAVTVPTPALSPILPIPLRKARDYRCQLDQPNPTTPYESPTVARTDFCGGTGEVVRIALSDRNGHILIFNQTGENNNTDAAAVKYSISVNTGFSYAGDLALTSNSRNQAAPSGYVKGNPIYLIEERAYTLKANGDLQLSVNGGEPTTLVKRIDNFRVSAKGYTDSSTNRIINPNPPVPIADICSDAPTTPTVDNPKYICKLNYNDLVTDPAMNWKMTAGVRVELRSKYDSTGQASATSVAAGDIAQVSRDKDKSTAAAEYFPRNVLSR
jgi:prepilin-type N-terminal cleavage/methylation domain-containing protein